MIKLIKFLIFSIFCIVFTSIHAQNENALSKEMVLLTQKKEFIAGETIVLKFKTLHTKSFQMYCSNSYGSTIINPIQKHPYLLFKMPYFISNKKGIVHWKIIENNTIKGKFKIRAKEKPKVLETYLGPPSIEAGKTDFTMIVVIPTDSLDNPLASNTEVSLKTQFLSIENKAAIFTKNLISYKNIYAPLKNGRMLISAESFGLNTKELDVNIVPAIATNFEIFFKRNHHYADGNQITTFYTSIIKDKNNNIVSDGSFVEFFITNKRGHILKTSGTTINGVAFAKILHPDYQDNWSIKAYITGVSESNTLEISYKKVITNFKVSFSKNHRNITVGPLKSFMNQMIPNGLTVKLRIYKNDQFINEMIKETSDGFAKFYLNKHIYLNEVYTFEVETANIIQTFKNKKLW